MSKANDEQTRRAIDYWGQLLKTDSIGPTPKLERLLKGIAACIRNTFGDPDSSDLTPTQLLQYYRSVNGNYDKLFTLDAKSLVIVYTKLRCLYSLQPDDDNGEFKTPSVPALKPAGWVKWSCIQLLLGPAEHAMFLQNALHRYDVKDTETGQLFPKLLPRQLFPAEPLEMMVRWHHDAGYELEHEDINSQMNVDKEKLRDNGLSPVPSGSNDSERQRKQDAAQYFSNPHFRDKDGTPTIVKRLSMMGSVALNFVKDVLDPDLFGGAQKRRPEKEEDALDNSPRPVEPILAPPPRPRSKQIRETFRRVQWDEESTESDDEYDTRGQARIRRHKSHEPVSSPKEYPGESSGPQYRNRNSTNPGINRLRRDGNTPSYSPRTMPVNNNVQTSKIRSPATPQGYFDVRPAEASQPTGGHDPRNVKGHEMADSESTIGLTNPMPIPSATPRPGPPAAHPPPPRARPEVRRQATPVKGVHGRVYPNEAGAFWRRK